MKNLLPRFALVLAAIVAAVVLFVAAGLYNVAADDEHTLFVQRLIETARERSIAVRAAKIEVPDLADPQKVRRGAGNYDSMCAGCHLAPGAQETELSRGLYPKPPNLSTLRTADPARAFWIIKHGIKATGMPAWGKSMQDGYIWDMVALLHQLATMSAEQYAAEVRASGGHSHGGGESTSGQDEHDERSPNGQHSHEHASPSGESAASGHTHANDESHAEPALPGDAVGTVKAFHAALSAGDGAAVERVLDPNVLIMEGGNVERSRQEYAAHHLKSDLKFMRAMKYTLGRQVGDRVGELAWVATEATLTGESQGKPVDLLSTESLVLKKTRAGWRIVHIHWSSRSRSEA